jgi:hypothetical protein
MAGLFAVACIGVIVIPSLMGGYAVAGQKNAGALIIGTWVADLSRSKLDPKYAFSSATLDISVSGETVTLASEVVHASGKNQRSAETFHTDGTETPGTLTPGFTHVARWVGPHVLAATAMKGGETVFLQTFQVSADGKLLTSRISGLVEQVVVFTRK